MIQIAGFVPDADPTASGILLDCENLIPTLKGMAGVNSLATPSGVPALAAACKGAAAVVTTLDGTRRLIAGTADALYELVAGSWTDRSAVGGYSGGADTQWSIAQFGDSTLAAQIADTIQVMTSGDFAAIAGAPKAEVIFSVGAFVMALNVDDGAEKPDGWHCCAAFDATDWAESVTTQSASGRLVSTPGELVAGGRLGEYAVAYKSRSIYLGQYVGAPDIWDWQLVIGGTAGCVGKKAWCDLDGTHFVVGEDNFWLFDGTRPAPLADGVLKEWFQNECDASYKYKIECIFDKATNRVWVFYPSAGSSSLDSALIYHTQSKKWGRAALDIETTLEYVTSQITIDDLDDYGATIDDLPAIPVDSPFWMSGARSLSVVNTSHQIQTFSGDSVSSSMTSGDVGDDFGFSLLQRVKCRFTQAPTSATLHAYYKNDSGDALTAGESVSMSGNKFDLLQSARWHRVKIEFLGPVEITAIGETHVPDGEE